MMYRFGAALVAALVGPLSLTAAQDAATLDTSHVAVAALVRQLGDDPPIEDAEFVRRFVSPAGFEWVPESLLVRQLGVMRSQSGGLRVTGSEIRGESLWLRVAPQEGAGAAWLELQIDGARMMPWLVRLDHFAVSGPPPELPQGQVPIDSVMPVVQRWLGWWEQHDRWSGTVGISRNDSTVLLRPIGLADRSRGTPNTIDTRYHLGSSNKMLTAVAILQLVQEGRIGLDEPIAKYLPDYPKPEIAQQITVRQLLAHTSGLGGLFNLPNHEPKRRYGSNVAYIPLIGEREPLFAPGTRYSYSNEAFVLAGAVIERVTGQHYGAALASRILEPAGMTGWCDCMGTPGAPRRAFGYSSREDTDPLGFGPLTDNEYFLFAEGMGAGGYYATAEDYLHFAAAMRRGVLVDSASQVALFTKTPQSPSPRGYGLGMQLVTYGGKSSWGHGGGGGRSGVGTQFATFTDGSWTVALMGNRDVYLANEMLGPLMNFLAQQAAH